eukprot:364795-Chlamydomonas_euryale.AAC.6
MQPRLHGKITFILSVMHSVDATQSRYTMKWQCPREQPRKKCLVSAVGSFKSANSLAQKLCWLTASSAQQIARMCWRAPHPAKRRSSWVKATLVPVDVIINVHNI